MSDYFEWDDGKALSNFNKHGVSFELAREVFKDMFAVDEIDDRENYGEDRFTIIGMVEGRLLHVAYATRNNSIRIISARLTSAHDRRRYYNANQI
jgi:uncharacterized protein